MRFLGCGSIDRPTRRSAASLAAFVGIAGALIGGCGGTPDGAPTVTDTIVEAPFSAVEEGDSLHLYFPGPGELLYEEERQLPPETDPERLILQIASEVLSGPTDPELSAPFTRPLKVGSVDVSPEGVIFVDLLTEDGTPPLPRGSTEEILALYSLVNSIVLNLEGAKAIVLLWNGRQLETLSGHIDTARPVRPDPALIAGTLPGHGRPIR